MSQEEDYCQFPRCKHVIWMEPLTFFMWDILGGSAPAERQVSPDKLYRAALLRGRFADTILKAREKALDQVCRDPFHL